MVHTQLSMHWPRTSPYIHALPLESGAKVGERQFSGSPLAGGNRPPPRHVDCRDVFAGWPGVALDIAEGFMMGFLK